MGQRVGEATGVDPGPKAEVGARWRGEATTAQGHGEEVLCGGGGVGVQERRLRGGKEQGSRGAFKEGDRESRRPFQEGKWQRFAAVMRARVKRIAYR